MKFCSYFCGIYLKIAMNFNWHQELEKGMKKWNSEWCEEDVIVNLIKSYTQRISTWKDD